MTTLSTGASLGTGISSSSSSLSSSSTVPASSSSSSSLSSAWTTYGTRAKVQLTTAIIQGMGIASIFTPSETDQPKDQRANSLLFTENGRYIASSHNDGIIYLISGENNQKEEFHVTDNGCSRLTETHHELCFLHAGTPPVGHPCNISYHNLHENKIVRYFRGHTDRITSISLSPDTSDVFLTTGLDGKFLLWDLRAPVAVASGGLTMPEKGTYQGLEPPHPIGSFDITGKVFGIAVPYRGIALYDATKLRDPVQFSKMAFSAPTDPLFQYTVTPTAGIPNNTTSNTLTTVSSLPTPPPFPSLVSFIDMKFSPDERLIALNTADRGVFILNAWNVSQELALLNKHPHDILHPSTVTWSPDGKFIAIGSVDGHVWVYDLSTIPSIPHKENEQEDEVVFPYRPGFWEPNAYVMGEAYMNGTVKSHTYESASKYNDDLFTRMHKSRNDFAQSRNIPIESIGPPRSVPSQTVPLATNADEQVSRHESPVNGVAWHPTSGVLASAAKNIAVWTYPGLE